MSIRANTPLDTVLQGLERGLRDQTAQLYRVYMSDKPDSTERLAAGIAAAVDGYHAAIEVAVNTVERYVEDVIPERETTGADYGAAES